MSTRPALKTQLDAVVYFFTKMDSEMISSLLDDQLTYQDYSKHLFVRKLGDLFFEFSQLGDFLLLVEKGECYGCSCGLSGYSFIGNKSRSFNKLYLDKYVDFDLDDDEDDLWEGGDSFFGDDDILN